MDIRADEGLMKITAAAARFSGLAGVNCYLQPRTTSQHSQTVHDYYSVSRDVANGIRGSGRCFN